MANSRRFKILVDKKFTFNSAVIAAGGDAVVNSANVHQDKLLNIYKKCSYPIEYAATTGALTEIRSNNIGLMIFARVGNRVNIVNGSCRIRYLDL